MQIPFLSNSPRATKRCIATVLLSIRAYMLMQTGDTALIKASACGHMDIVNILVESGAILNLKKASGHTALAVAVLNQHHKVVDRLLMAGADAGIRDNVREINL